MEENKEVTKKNTKLFSTIILLIFLVLSILVLCLVLSFDFHAMAEQAKAQSDNTTEQVVGGLAIGLGLGILFALMLFVSIALVVVDLLCLFKAINNRKSDVKWIRILSYVLDGSFSLIIILTIIRFITWVV